MSEAEEILEECIHRAGEAVYELIELGEDRRTLEIITIKLIEAKCWLDTLKKSRLLRELEGEINVH